MPRLCPKTKKQCFPTRLDAQIKLARIQNNRSHKRKQRHTEEPVRIYRCEFCRQFHLTSQAKGEGRGKR